VIDNGIGIPPENLTRIFNHGFTTRKGGHGFGLHSGALAAKEMGGSLTVQSDGPGQGAAFTLELPCPKRRSTPMNNNPTTKTGACWSLMTIAPSTMIFARFLSPATPPPRPWTPRRRRCLGCRRRSPQTQFEVDSAYQGQEGVLMVKKALAAGRPYAMAFVDVRMPPGWDGVETTQRDLGD
jgi:hypothetical protein